MIRIVFLFAIVFFTAGCSVTEVAEIIYDSVKEYEDRDESDKQRRDDDGHAEKPLVEAVDMTRTKSWNIVRRQLEKAGTRHQRLPNIKNDSRKATL
jgi:hypothetical protein